MSRRFPWFFLLMISLLLPFFAEMTFAADWPQFRGPGRDGLSDEVPRELPPKRLLWKQPLTGETHAGIVAGEGFVVVPDHGAGKDYFRCFRLEDGQPVWVLAYEQKGHDMEFGRGPRATPVIHQGWVYTLGAFGQLCGVHLSTGKKIWVRHLAKDFGAEVPKWGYCSSPLIVDNKLIVNPGGKKASVVALDPKSGKTIWQTPGRPPAYASFIAGVFGGVHQVVGYDEQTLGGWEVSTGRRLWTLTQESTDDYNVVTPVALDGKVLYSTDMNYARLFAFGPGGVALPQPVAKSEDLGSDMATPVAYNGFVFGPTYGLTCLDPAAGLKTLWKYDEEPDLTGFCTLIAGNERLMVFSESGTLFLVAAEGTACRILGKMSLCGKTLSHPALAHGRLLIRDAKAVYCYDFGAKSHNTPLP